MVEDSTGQAIEWLLQEDVLLLIGAMVIGVLAMPFGTQVLYTGILGQNVNALIVGIVFGVGGAIVFFTAITIFAYKLLIDSSVRSIGPRES